MSTKSKDRSKNEPIAAASIPITNPRGIASIYSNNIGVSSTMLDFTLFFVETGQLPGENGPVPKNELKAAVTLPMPSAGALIQALTQMLETGAEQMKAHMATQMAEAVKAAKVKGLAQARVQQ
jgi:hypothetical protein